MKDRTLVIVVIIVMACVGAIFFLSRSNVPRYQWFETYRAGSEQPYGLSFLLEILKGYRQGNEFTFNQDRPLKEVLKAVQNPESTDYIFVGHDIFLDQESCAALAKFIDSGGSAFIACLAPPEAILYSVYFPECGQNVDFESYLSPSADFNFYHPRLHTRDGVRFDYRFVGLEAEYPWKYVSTSAFCDSARTVAALGFMDEDRVNFIRVSIGKGYLYLHTNPLAFTNYALTDKSRADYVAGVFSHLDGENIIWDEFSKIPMPGDENPYNSPLYYILEQPSLKYAWWLLLITAVVYVFFAAKRKQRPIPVIELKTNTSLEFVKMISGLYYKNANHLDMAHKKMRYFLYFVRSKYGIHAEKFGEDQIRRLAEKAKVELADVQIIFSRYHLIEDRFKNSIEASRLVDLCDSIDNFYRLSK